MVSRSTGETTVEARNLIINQSCAVSLHVTMNSKVGGNFRRRASRWMLKVWMFITMVTMAGNYQQKLKECSLLGRGFFVGILRIITLPFIMVFELVASFLSVVPKCRKKPIQEKRINETRKTL